METRARYEAPRIGRGVLGASVAAGPIFMTASAVVGVLRGANFGVIGPDDLPFVFVLLALSVPFGFVLAAIPNLLGAWALSRLGRGNDAVRLPVVWAVIGALAAGLAIAAADPADAESIAAFSATGAACALLCRWGTRWE